MTVATESSPFRLQISEYDCVPTTLLNALVRLFSRKEIPPEVIQRIYTYCLDKRSKKGVGFGTTGAALGLISNWLNEYKNGPFRINARHCRGDEVHLGRGNIIARCLNDDGLALLRVKDRGDEWHYILALSIEDRWVNCFDPYPKKRNSKKAGEYEFIAEAGFQSPNLRIASDWLDTKSNQGLFRLGSSGERECVLIRRVK